MARRVTLNLELNKRILRAGGNTPGSDKSVDSGHSGYSKMSSVTSNGSRLKETIVKTREIIRARVGSRTYSDVSGYNLNELSSAKLESPQKEIETKLSDRQNMTNKLNMKKYSTFLIRKMQRNEFLNNLLIDRTPENSNLLEMIETGQTEPALLLTLQLLCDVVVHCESAFQG